MNKLRRIMLVLLLMVLLLMVLLLLLHHLTVVAAEPDAVERPEKPAANPAEVLAEDK